MRKILGVAFLQAALLLGSCGGDDDDNNNGNGTPTVPEVVAVASVTAPDVSNVNDPVWNSATAKALDIDYRNAPPAATATLSDSVWVQAITSGGELFLRLVWSDDSLNMTRYNWTLTTLPPNFLFTRSVESSGEDQVYVMFKNGSEWDTWNWRSLTTGPADLAEGMVWDGLTLTPDSGAQIVAYNNFLMDPSRPLYVHETMSAFDDVVLHIADTLRATQAISHVGWELGDKVPGYYVDTSRSSWLEGHPESRWDIEAGHSYSSSTDRHTLVLTCDMTGSNAIGTPDDLNMTGLDILTVRVGILNDHANINVGGTSARGFTQDFHLVLP